MSEDTGDIVKELQNLRSKAENLCKLSESLCTISGMPKLFRKCKAELQFLDRTLSNQGKISWSQLNSSNLAHLQGILQGVQALSSVSQVLRTFRIPDVDHPVCVDVICDHGRTWVKVVARNSKALLLDSMGQQAFGEKTVLDQARQYQRAARDHPHNYAAPCIAFLFFHDVPKQLHEDLNKLGVTAWEYDKLTEHANSGALQSCSAASVVESSDEEEDENTDFQCETVKENAMANVCRNSEHCRSSSVSGLKNFCSETCVCAEHFKRGKINSAELSLEDPSIHDVGRVNLDITTLFALVSNLCHGHCELVFQEKILTQQAAEERSHPLLPELLNFLIGKQLFVCETALSDFQTILSTVGGPLEKQRASTLLQYVEVVSDCPSPRSLKLPTSSKLNSRAKVIFGSGDSLKAVTTTANQGFVRAASQSSADFVVFLHSARALTEQKESLAVPI